MFRNRGAYRRLQRRTPRLTRRQLLRTIIVKWHHGTLIIINVANRGGLTLFLVFNLFRSNDIFSGQFTKLYLHFGVANPAGVPPTFVGLIPQIDGAGGGDAGVTLS
jgi:hypothetical protein